MKRRTSIINDSAEFRLKNWSVQLEDNLRTADAFVLAISES